MSANRASSGGVRNLRAMFENQNTPSSPEPRGHSPVGNATSNTEEIRSTSKVRASFVSVKSTAFVGTAKSTSDGLNSPTANRGESFSIIQEHGSELIEELKKTVSQEKEDRKRSLDIEEVVEERESSIPAPEIRDQATSGIMFNLGSIMKGSNFPEPGSPLENKKAKTEEPVAKTEDTPATPVKEVEKPASPSKDAPSENPDKPVSSAEDKDVSLRPLDPKDEAAVSSGEAPPLPAEAPLSLAKKAPAEASAEASKSTAEKTKASVTASQPKAKVNGTTSHTTTSKTAAKSSSHKLPAISTAKENITKPSSSKSAAIPKSPALPKTPRTPTALSVTSPTKSPVSKLSLVQAKDQSKAPAAKATRSSLRPSTASVATNATTKPKAPSKPATPAATKEAAKETTKDTAKDATNTSPFGKPRPKSPTRPVRLPPHLIAPTASYAAKHEDGTVPQTLTRRPSTIARERPATLKPAAPARKPAGRLSLGPLSLGPQLPKRPDSRQSIKGPDEGFLARMMRPTASSASKTHDKVNSPPRRTASVRSKAGQGESIVAKGKRKVGEGVTKVKERVTANGTGEGSHHEEESGPAEPATEGAATGTNEEGDAAHESAPAETTAGTGELMQTPNFEGETIR
ncbi:uncharacterized protein K441DRAFT_599902 [Cenococcum geophilum 1.58]|uniref:uncharacterized protein n=1 Tax=Cenococcum geophilum 1.58 TaxID=794803 RepID=UPI00358F2A28|nr:hypothetical protein K441DRAFT_599902 [Cenococcum geophilum 1.58]